MAEEDDTENETLETVADYIADVRTLLQDVISPYRYTDAELVTAFNITLLETRRLRPDLFVYTDSRRVQNFATTGSAFGANDTTEVNIEPQFRLALVNGICAHALMRDQEDVQDARASSFMAIFTSILTGVAQPPIEGGARTGVRQ